VGVRTMRVSLLFGLHDASVEASKLGALLTAMRSTIWNEVYHRDGPDFDEAFKVLMRQCAEFIDQARAEIQRPAWRRQGSANVPSARLMLPDETEHLS
jgi:hypothetical protein